MSAPELAGQELNMAEQVADYLCEYTDLPETDCNQLGLYMVPRFDMTHRELTNELRGLIRKWRESSRREGGTLDDLESCADELERAIGGGES